jgi:hypothetical protein
VSLIGTCCPEITVVNRAKFCCTDLVVDPHEPQEEH